MPARDVRVRLRCGHTIRPPRVGFMQVSWFRCPRCGRKVKADRWENL